MSNMHIIYHKPQGSDSYKTSSFYAVEALNFSQKQWSESTADQKEKILQDHFKEKYETAERRYNALDPNDPSYAKKVAKISLERNEGNDAGNILRSDIQKSRELEEKQGKYLDAFGIDKEKWTNANSKEKEAILNEAIKDNPKIQGYSVKERDEAIKSLERTVESQGHNEDIESALDKLGIDKEKWGSCNGNNGEKENLLNNFKPRDTASNPDKVNAFRFLKGNCGSLNAQEHWANDETDHEDPYKPKELGMNNNSGLARLPRNDYSGNSAQQSYSLGSVSEADISALSGSFSRNNTNNCTMGATAKNMAPASDIPTGKLNPIVEFFHSLFESAFVSEDSCSTTISSKKGDSLSIKYNPKQGTTEAKLDFFDDTITDEQAAKVTAKGLELYTDPNTSAITEFDASSPEVRQAMIDALEKEGYKVSKNAMTPQQTENTQQQLEEENIQQNSPSRKP